MIERNEGEPKGSVERVLRLLAFFEGEQRRATLSELARATGLSPPTALRLLRVLEHASFLQRDPDRRYRLGPRLVQLGVLALRDLSIHDLARQHLRELAAETGETASLGIAANGSILYIDQVPSPQAIQYVTWVGRTVPLEGTAIGEAIRGGIGASGYVVKSNTVEPDVTAVAAPVYGASGVAGAINVTGPTYRMPDDTVRRVGELVTHHTTMLSWKLGSNHGK